MELDRKQLSELLKLEVNSAYTIVYVVENTLDPRYYFRLKHLCILCLYMQLAPNKRASMAIISGILALVDLIFHL